MATEINDKIKNSIDLNSLKILTYEKALLYKILPLCLKNNIFYIAIAENKTQNTDINDYLKKVLKNTQYNFIPINETIIENLINEYKSKFKQQDQDGSKNNIVPKKDLIVAGNKNVVVIKNTERKRLGEMLKDADLINDEILNECLVEAKSASVPIGSVLVQKGYITLDQLRAFLSAQQGREYLHADNLKIDLKALKLLPEDFIKSHKIIPISSDGKTLILGMVNPSDKKSINEVVYMTGQKPVINLITHIEFCSVFSHYFKDEKGREVEREEDDDDENDIENTLDIMKQMEAETEDFEVEESLSSLIEREIQESTGSVAKFNNQIIQDAINAKASDIHIEPRLNNYIVRFRIDGILKEVLKLPPKVENAIITRFKVLAKMNIAEHRRPQDGTFSIKYKKVSYDFRINTLPVNGREKVVIRVLAPAVTINANDKNIKLVGASNEDLKKVYNMIAAPNGIILASGPTGSGKTTTLYSLMKSINDSTVNITTIEDPVEIKIEGLNQSQINVKADITFASCMKAILRQDPDIIMIGEIRDYETLETAIAAAQTGHLVLSTVHTNSAVATVTRLVEMGAKDYLVASSLTGVIAQRLVRKLCPHCREPYHPSIEEAKQVVMLKNKNDYEKFMEQTIYRAKGCVNCKNEGYQGRIGLYEVFQVTKEIKKMIAGNALELDIEEKAIQNGMTTLREACFRHLINGDTTINEYIRVLGPVND